MDIRINIMLDLKIIISNTNKLNKLNMIFN